MHVFKAWVWGNDIMEGKLVVFTLSHLIRTFEMLLIKEKLFQWKILDKENLLCGESPPRHLPDNKAKGVHVRRLERLKA